MDALEIQAIKGQIQLTGQPVNDGSWAGGEHIGPGLNSDQAWTFVITKQFIYFVELSPTGLTGWRVPFSSEMAEKIRALCTTRPE